MEQALALRNCFIKIIQKKPLKRAFLFNFLPTESHIILYLLYFIWYTLAMESGQKITANTRFFMLSLVLQKVLSFVYFTFLARTLGVSAIGQYFFAISFATMFSVLVDLGLSPLIIREVAKKTEQSKNWFYQIFSLKIIFAVLTALPTGHSP